MQCANCGKKYSQFSIANANWCRRDQQLFCLRCSGRRKRVCPRCGSSLRGWAGAILLYGLVFGTLGLVLLGSALPGVLHQLALDQMPATSLEGLTPGSSLVKVVGTVAPGQGTVLEGWEEQGANGNYQWTWSVRDDFNITDNRTQVLVDLSALQYYLGSPRLPPGQTNGTDYRSGDQVALIGTVGAQGNRTVVYAQYITDRPYALYPDPLLTIYLFGPFAGTGLALLALGVILDVRHARISEANLLRTGRAMQFRQDAVAPRSEVIQWTENGYLAQMRSVAIWAGVATAVAVPGGFALGVWGFSGGPPWTITASALLLVVGLMVGVTTYSFGSLSRRGIARLGFAESGLYVGYRRAPPKDARTYFAWTEVSEISTGEMANRRLVVLKTSFGDEYLSNLATELVSSVRSAFERRTTAGAPPVARGEVLRPRLPDLLGPVSAGRDAEFQWRSNSYRQSKIRLGASLLAAQVPIAILFALFVYPRIGFNQGDMLFFLPGMWGAASAYAAYANFPQSLGISNGGFRVRRRRGESSCRWEDLQTLVPDKTLLRYKTRSGYSELIFGVDRAFVVGVVEGLETFRMRERGVRRTPLSPSSPVDWRPNAARARAAWLYWVLLLAPLGGAAATTLLAYRFVQDWILAGAMGLMPLLIMLGALYVRVPYVFAPARVGFSSDGLRVEYASTDPSPSLLREVAWNDIAQINLEGALPRYLSGGWIRTNARARYLNVQNAWGTDAMLGPISAELETLIVSRLPPAARAGWKGTGAG